MSHKYASLIGRYVWLVDLLCHHRRLTFQQISDQWEKSGLNHGEPLVWRTFQHHRDAIFDIFGIVIECEHKGDYAYYIDHPEKLANDHLRSWLISSFATLNQIQADPSLEGRIIYEQIPSGEKWLTLFTQAMRESKIVNICYKAFQKSETRGIVIEPYCLKVVKRRWYVIARKQIDREQHVFTIYALDRITKAETTDELFQYDFTFDIDRFFEGCSGIMLSDMPVERIVVKSYYYGPDYLRALPLHTSQKELPSNDSSYALFEYHVKPTFDFYLALLGQADQLKVVSPQHVREEMARLVRHMASYYME